MYNYGLGYCLGGFLKNLLVTLLESKVPYCMQQVGRPTAAHVSSKRRAHDVIKESRTLQQGDQFGHTYLRPLGEYLTWDVFLENYTSVT
jgi:hypothetical protein